MLIVKETWEEFRGNCVGSCECTCDQTLTDKCGPQTCPRVWKATTVEVADNLAELCEDLSETLLKLGMVAAQLDPSDGKDLYDGRDSQDAV